MNQEIKKIFEQYFNGKLYEQKHKFKNKYDESMIFEKIFIGKNFVSDYPVYYICYYIEKPTYFCPFPQKLIKTTKNNYLNVSIQKSNFPKQLSDSLKFFDYYEDKKNFFKYENKKILQTIYLILRKKIPFLSIILILSFIRTVHLGNTLYLKKYEEIPEEKYITVGY